MSKFKCVIFDCDGVLVDSEPIGNRVLVDMTNQLGASIDLDYAYQHFKGGSLKSCMIKISNLIDKKLPEDFESQYRQNSFEVFKKEMQPIDGVLELVKNLKIPFCVASSGPESKIRLNLELTGLLTFFQNKIFSCYEIQKWKPDPAIFIWAAETMGFQPQDCLVIEDSVIGVRAAKAGGFHVYGYAAHDFNNELEAEANVVFTEMSELIQLMS